MLDSHYSDTQYPDIGDPNMYGKPDSIDRLVQAMLALAALASIANGLFMLTDPFGWYDFVDTVKAT
ncbi:MAG: hypothetical protein OEZ09_15945, partial [Betaproteobacteria bacterium]|nr:hypothetical protein [Betaproteobacteria bacterium]